MEDSVKMEIESDSSPAAAIVPATPEHRVFAPPAFCRVLCRTHIEYKVGMIIPSQFYSQYAHRFRKGIVLQHYMGGKQWRTRLSGDRIVKNWHKFVTENNLKVGNIVIFRLANRNTLTFQAFHEDGLEVERSPEAGVENEGAQLDTVENEEEEDDEPENSPPRILYSDPTGTVHPAKNEKKCYESEVATPGTVVRKKQKTSYYESEVYNKFKPSPCLPVLAVTVTDLSRLYLVAPSHEYFPREISKVRLIDEAGLSWLISWFPRTRQMAGGVNKFLVHHNVACGDILEFEQQSSNTFKVMIVRNR